MTKSSPLSGFKVIGATRTVRGFFPALVAAFLWLALSTLAIAANFTVTLDRDTITVGESAALTMLFEGNEPATMPVLPSIPNLNIGGPSRSDQTSLVFDGANSQSSHKITYVYSLNPTQPGVYVIPGFTVVIDGQPFNCQPLKLTVNKTPPPPTGINAANPDIAFIRLEVPKQTVYVGEVVRAELQLYLRDGIQSIRDFQMVPPPVEGFTVGKTMEGPHRQARVGNFGYNIIPMTMIFTAAKTGPLTLGPTECSMNLLSGPFDFFGRPTRVQNVKLTNESVTVQSLPLPKNNVPPGFCGAVGNYSLAVTVSPTNIAMGDPITVKAQITGHGAVDAITLPPQEGWQQFKLYPPTTDFQPSDQLGLNGTKTFTLTAVPQSMDVTALPPFTFSFFDPDQKTYRTLTHPPTPLIVRPSAASLPAPVLSNVNPGDAQPASKDIVHIKARLGVLAQVQPPLVRQPWFVALQGVPVLAWLSLLVNRKQKERLANNPRLRRQRDVEKTTRNGLKELRQSANSNQSEQFFATLFHLMQEQLGERLDLPASAITEAVVEERLRPLQVPEETLDLLRELFLACNQARYSRQSTNEELISLIPLLESAIAELKKIKS
jgi:hypothetical protein